MLKFVCKECGIYIKVNLYEYREIYQFVFRGSIVSDIGNIDVELFLIKGIFYFSKKQQFRWVNIMGQIFKKSLVVKTGNRLWIEKK